MAPVLGGAADLVLDSSSSDVVVGGTTNEVRLTSSTATARSEVLEEENLETTGVA